MSSAPHILIVDDHREIRDAVSRYLERNGFRASTARDAVAVVAVVTKAVHVRHSRPHAPNRATEIRTPAIPSHSIWPIPAFRVQ